MIISEFKFGLGRLFKPKKLNTVLKSKTTSIRRSINSKNNIAQGSMADGMTSVIKRGGYKNPSIKSNNMAQGLTNVRKRAKYNV